MKPTDAARFGQLLTAVAEVFNAPLSTARIEGYWLALRDLDLVAFELAAGAAMQECQFFPLPVELRDLALHGVIRSPQDRRQDANLAEAIRRNDELLQRRQVARVGGRSAAPVRLADVLRVVPGGAK